MPDELVAQIEGAAELKQEDGTLGIWPENWDIVMAFAAVASQWRTEALGEGAVLYVGLDYTAVDVGLRRAGLTLDTAGWQGLQVMEHAAYRALNERLRS
ncbi:DUF1799 domain-containing protein [Citromicrobium bathyomarinum]|uniref:DUF1799 domain-containing protein n=2 Tax=Citromicrobium TaxID=72173 RepID=UPI0022770D44|nr:DUF1799 domain-containing protein [Citromicrobium bathyomarinum]